jgi:hypothetical protein
MDHAEARDRLADALLTPGGLDAALLAGDQGTAELRDHLAGCAACRAEVDALDLTGLLLAAGAPDDLPAPPAARARILAAVRETGRPRPLLATATPAPPATAPPVAAAPAALPPAPRWRLPRLALPLAAGAMAVLLLAGALLVGDLAGQRDRTQRQVAAVVEVVTATGQILASPDHASLALSAPDGARGGTVLYSPSSEQLVVWGRGLDETAPDERYDCYVIHGDQTIPVGYMHQAGGLAYWVGSAPSGTTLGAPGDRFVVISNEAGSEPALSGTF